MSKDTDQAIIAIKLLAKGKQIAAQREVAHKRHQLAESEFEALIQGDDVSREKLEASRVNMIALYEQYIDACLALRSHGIETNNQIEEMMRKRS